MSEKQTPDHTLTAASAVSEATPEAIPETKTTEKQTTAASSTEKKSDSRSANKNINNDEKAMKKVNDNTVKTEKTAPAPVAKSGGKGLSLLAILIALGLGAGGYFWGTQQLSAVQQQVTALSSELTKLQNQAPQAASAVQLPIENRATQDNSELLSRFAELQTAQADALQQTQHEIQQLSTALDLQKSENNELRNQLNKLSFNNKADPNDWLMSEADFLLTNAQRKLVLDNDIDTVISLLQEANQTLQQVTSSQALSIRTAISNDLTQLQNVNDIDQDLIMSQLSLLVSQVDNLKVLALNPSDKASIEVSDSINDWQQNLEKSASSFLSHFIQVRKKDPNRPEFLAPDQDIFLKENIRLSLQVALSAVPRQQNEVYKQSLNSVASWLRSYFDTDDYSVQQFLQQVDQLKEQSIYVNAPQQLSAWQAIGTALNRDHRTLEQFSNAEAEKAAAEKAERAKAAEAEAQAEQERAKQQAEAEKTALEEAEREKSMEEQTVETPANESAVTETTNDNATTTEQLPAAATAQ